MLATSCLIGFGAQHFMPFMNVFFSKELHATPAQLGIVFAISQASVAAATMLSPWLARSLGWVRAITLVQWIATPLLFLMSWSPGLWPTAIAFALRTTFMQMVNPIKGQFVLSQVNRDHRGKASAVLNLGNSLSQSAGSYSAAFVIPAFGYGAAFQTAAGAYALSTVLFWWWFRRLDDAR